MSYILDALRRAQAERGRGSVPDLHTPATPVTGLPAAHAGKARGMAWLLTGLAAAAAVAGAGWWFWRTPVAPVAPGTPAAAGAESVATVTGGVPVAPAPAPAPPRVEKRQPAPQPPAERPERRAARAPESTAAPAPRPAPKPAPAASANPPPVFAKADLPPAVRDQLPTLQLAGVTYSTNPLYRMVIVNGQVLHEGDQAAPGLVLERIEPGRTVWAFRGYRYALSSQ